MAARHPQRNFHAEAANRLDAGQLRPCRTADSIFPIPPPRPPPHLWRFCLCSSPGSLRAYNYQRHASPGTLLERPRVSSFPPRSLFRVSPPPSAPSPRVVGRFPNTRKKPRLTAGLRWVPTGARPHAGGATAPHYHTIFMLAPPGPGAARPRIILNLTQAADSRVHTRDPVRVSVPRPRASTLRATAA